MKKLFPGVLALLVWAGRAPAIDFGALRPQGYVSDFAGVIDAGSRGKLEQYCGELERVTGAQLAVVTLPSLGGEPVQDVANTLFRKWGIGKKGRDTGALLLLSIQDRRSRLEVGYGLGPAITDGDAGSILRAMRPYLRQQRYGEALLAASAEVGSRITRAKGAAVPAPAPNQPQPPPERAGAVVAALLASGMVLFIALAFLIGGRRRRVPRGGFGGFWPGFILGSMTGRSLGWRSSGGGFGGFDSKDSFGGFGGGDSGGGGASSDW